MPTKTEVEEYLAKNNVEAELEKAIKELVREGMPPNPLKVISEKLMKAAGGGICFRITQIPIKAGSMEAIVKIANGDEFLQHTKTFVGFDGVDVFAVGDDTMVTASRWVDQAACDGGAAALGGVLKGFMSEFVAGPPKPPAVGVPLLRLQLTPTEKKPETTVYVCRCAARTLDSPADHTTCYSGPRASSRHSA